MPYSFVAIEKEKTHTIAVLLVILVVMYFFTCWGAWLIVKNAAVLQATRGEGFRFLGISLPEVVVVFLIAMIAGVVHYAYSTSRLIPRLLALLKAEPLDTHSRTHQQLQNIIDEVCVAAGGLCIQGCVVRSAACNAFSLSDGKENSYIGVTEGLLLRLNRAQLESVIGHEAAHIAMGDTVIYTVSTSLFGMYEGAMSGLRESCSGGRSLRGRGGGFWFPGGLALGFIMCMHGLNRFIMASVAQEKEFRADAVAVKLTRNPLALAESLYIVSQFWHGQKESQRGLESLFFADPAVEEETVFSSHPPLSERLGILLAMAHADEPALEAALARVRPRIRQAKRHARASRRVRRKTDGQAWSVLEEGRWKGPFVLSELQGLKWFTASHKVRREGAPAVKPAYEDHVLRSLFASAANEKEASFSCPHCYQGLSPRYYEGEQIHVCPSCKGVLCGRSRLDTILIREEASFSPETVELAHHIKDECEQRFKEIRALKTPFILPCPQCGKKMRRKLLSRAAPVEVDLCIWCDLVWLDRGELELVQVLYDEREDKDSFLA
ncbi:MAG: M48 family metalloprotease [Candidatus Omnitrophica bacterium]|nr:M48 family metalloprotease [Candidatus Omnitrophota bacterium]